MVCRLLTLTPNHICSYWLFFCSGFFSLMFIISSSTIWREHRRSDTPKARQATNIKLLIVSTIMFILATVVRWHSVLWQRMLLPAVRAPASLGVISRAIKRIRSVWQFPDRPGNCNRYPHWRRFHKRNLWATNTFRWWIHGQVCDSIYYCAILTFYRMLVQIYRMYIIWNRKKWVCLPVICFFLASCGMYMYSSHVVSPTYAC